jgi:hypothetical protein
MGKNASKPSIDSTNSLRDSVKQRLSWNSRERGKCINHKEGGYFGSEYAVVVIT